MQQEYTFLMSVYYKEKPEYLKMSIESMLRQTVQAKEIIIVKDGGLTDELEEVLCSFCNQYPSLFKVLALKENVGLGPALVYGMDKVSTELVARMDSDDYSVPQRCEKQIQQFLKDPELAIVGTSAAEFVNDISNVVSIHSVPEKNQQIYEGMKRRCVVTHPTVMYKKSAVIEAGNYQNVPLYEDYDLFSRMILEKHVKCYNIQESLYYVRTCENFWYRRGGKRYLQTMLSFKWNLFVKRNISIMDFVISGFGQAIVCLMPNRLRQWFYLSFLRN